MFRFGATRLGAGGAAAAAAGAAAATSSTSSQAHARARPARVARLADRSQDVTKLEEDWLGVDLEGEEIVFQPEEVKEAIEDIFNVSNSPIVQEPDDTDSVESFGREADEILEENIVPTSSSSSSSSTGIAMLANFTEKLLTRQSVQRELLSALKEDDEMREMFARMTGAQDLQTPMLPYTPRAALPAPEEVEVVGGNEDMNPLQAIVHDIGKGLETAGDHMKKAGDAVGNFLGRTGRWLKHRVARIEQAVEEPDENVTVEEELQAGEKVAGAALCLAGAVMVVLVARRFGFLRVFRVVV